MCLRYQEATNAVTVRRATPLNERIHRARPRVDTPNLGLHGEHFPLCGSENYFSTLENKRATMRKGRDMISLSQ